MTDQQAAEMLRGIVASRRMPPSDKDQMEFAEAEERGADAIEMLAWLCAPTSPLAILRFMLVYEKWDGGDDFHTYCEQQWRDSRG